MISLKILVLHERPLPRAEVQLQKVGRKWVILHSTSSKFKRRGTDPIGKTVEWGFLHRERQQLWKKPYRSGLSSRMLSFSIQIMSSVVLLFCRAVLCDMLRGLMMSLFCSAAVPPWEVVTVA